MVIAMVKGRLKAIRRTKLYDLFAAAPLIAWFVFCATQMLPSVVQQIALVKLMVQTDPSVLPASLVLSSVSHITTLVFFAVLVVMYVVRQVPQRTALGFYPRCAAVAGTFLGVGIVLLPPQELSSAALPSLASLDYQRHCFRNLCGACTRALNQHPAGGSATGNLGALCPRPPSTLSWRDRCCDWSCAAVPVGMGSVAAGTAMRSPTSAHEKRGTGAISKSFRNTETTWRGPPVWCRACTSGRSSQTRRLLFAAKFEQEILSAGPGGPRPDFAATTKREI